jgi:hypothetical protein
MLFFSHNNASIASIIPAMDKLNNGLNPHSKESYHPAIKAAMRLAKSKMNRYYSITDRSAVYQIAMGTYIQVIHTKLKLIRSLLVLHPCLKLDYFRVQEWEDKWIDIAKNLFCEEYIGEYENRVFVDDNAYVGEEVSDSINLSVWLTILTHANREATTVASETSQ